MQCDISGLVWTQEFIYFYKLYACFMSLQNVDMVSGHTACDTSYFHFFTLFLSFQCIAFFVAFYLTLKNALCMCLLVLSSSLSLSRIISSSSSGIARNHHAAAAAGAGCSITGDPYHGKHLKPLKMAPYFSNKSPSLNLKGAFSWQYNKNCISKHYTSAKYPCFIYYTLNNAANKSRGYDKNVLVP